VDLTFFIYFIIGGMACGFVDASLGMGFGVSASSVLVSFFGVAPVIASAAVHTAEMFVDIVSGISHWREGNVNFTVSKNILIPGVIASILGAVFLNGLSLAYAKPLVKISLIILGGIIVYKHLKEEKPMQGISKIKAQILGFIAAFVDVAIGGGWGPIGTPALILSGEDPRKAVGTIEFTEPVISLVAVLTFGYLIGFESFISEGTLPMILGGAVVSPIASKVTARIPKKTLGILIGLTLIGLNVWGLLA